jgi:hypothetical protein
VSPRRWTPLAGSGAGHGRGGSEGNSPSTVPAPSETNYLSEITSSKYRGKLQHSVIYIHTYRYIDIDVYIYIYTSICIYVFILPGACSTVGPTSGGFACSAGFSFSLAAAQKPPETKIAQNTNASGMNPVCAVVSTKAGARIASRIPKMQAPKYIAIREVRSACPGVSSVRNEKKTPRALFVELAFSRLPRACLGKMLSFSIRTEKKRKGKGVRASVVSVAHRPQALPAG